MSGNDMAFPVLDRDQTPNNTHQLGLTKRELFAALILSGLCGNPDPQVGQAGSEGRARSAVIEADALLAALDGEPEGRISMSEWQPMTTAPKTGPVKDILLACEWRGAVRPVIVIAHWAHGGGEEQPPFGPAWFYRTSGDGFYELPQHAKPLAWMEAPEPPEREPKDVWCVWCRSFTCKPGCARKATADAESGEHRP